jgi:hypothetical protein
MEFTNISKGEENSALWLHWWLQRDLGVCTVTAMDVPRSALLVSGREAGTPGHAGSGLGKASMPSKLAPALNN